MRDECGREIDNSISRAAPLLLEYLRVNLGCGRIVGREIRVAQTPATKIHPAILWRCRAITVHAITCVVDQGYIMQCERSYSSILNTQDAILTCKTTTTANLGCIHCLQEKMA